MAGWPARREFLKQGFEADRKAALDRDENIRPKPVKVVIVCV